MRLPARRNCLPWSFKRSPRLSLCRRFVGRDDLAARTGNPASRRSDPAIRKSDLDACTGMRAAGTRLPPGGADAGGCGRSDAGAAAPAQAGSGTEGEVAQAGLEADGVAGSPGAVVGVS